MRVHNLSPNMSVYFVIWADLVGLITQVLEGSDSLTCRREESDMAWQSSMGNSVMSFSVCHRWG